MKPKPDIEALLDSIRRRRPTPEEAASLRRRLEGHPGDQRRLDEELALDQALDCPEVPVVSSNFLARVEQRIAADASADRRTAARRSWGLAAGSWFQGWRWRVLAPAIPVLALSVAVGGWWQHRAQQRGLLAASLSTLAPGDAVPGMESLQDFDAVQWLRSGPAPGDMELLAALDTEPLPPAP